MLSVPSALALFAPRRNTGFWMALVFLIFVILIGLRFNVGMDWNNYEYRHTWIVRESFTDLLRQPEPLSSLLFWSSARFGFGSTLSNIVAAALLMLGVLSFAARTRSPWLAVVAATPYLVIVFGMSGIRQAMAAGVVLLVLANWSRISASWKIAGMVVASLFHTSALLGVLLVIWEAKLRTGHKFVLAIFLFGVFYLIGGLADLYKDSWEFYQDAYLAGSDSIESPGAKFHVFLVAFPAAIFFIYRAAFNKFLPLSSLLAQGAAIAIALLAFMFVSTTGASRLTVYLYFVPMCVYAALPYIFVEKQKDLAAFGIVLAHFIILASWLFFANNSAAYIPYRNLLLQ
jgi:hypothetical protein